MLPLSVSKRLPGMVVHARDPTPRETEAGRQQAVVLVTL